MKIPPPSTILIGVALAFLTVKDLQEIAGIRMVSLLIPIFLAALYASRLRELAVPKMVLAYIIYICVILPLVSIANKGAISIYEPYLIATVFCGYLLVAIPYSLLKRDTEWLGNMYLNAILVMCVLSYLTFQKQWFGSYTIRSFSDFRTFFALQASIAVPFVNGRHRNLVRGFLLATMFATFSRLSFFLSAFVVVFQSFKENKVRFILLLPISLVLFAIFLLGTTPGNLMLAEMASLTNLDSLNFGQHALDSSDVGRIAYLVTTIQHIDTERVLFVGHGIKTNHEIIAKYLNTMAWHLPPGAAVATVHNVYLELLSDTGLLGLVPFVICLFYAGLTLARYRGVQSKYFISFAIFFLSYMFEANYASFFFQFAVLYFLFAAYEARADALSISRGSTRCSGLFGWIVEGYTHPCTISSLGNS